MEPASPPKPHLWQEWPIALLLLAPFVGFAIVLPQLPARVPMHFDLHGHVDHYGSPWGLLILPGINVAVAVLLYFVPRLDPHQANIVLSMPAYRWIRIFVATLLTYIFFIAMANMFDPTLDVLPAIAIGLLVLFLGIGAALPKLKQNYMIGIRLPWTLESEQNWDRTHAFAGTLWIYGSIAGIVLVLLVPAGSIFIALGIILLLAVWTGIYSYRTYQKH